MKRVLKVVVVALLLFISVGCSLTEEATKTYSANGVKVTMKDGLTEKTNMNFTTYLEGTDVMFTALKESFDITKQINLDENSSVREYTEKVLQANGLNETINEKDGLTYFTYEKEISGTKYFYFATTYKSNDAFWLINFACLAKDKAKYESKFIKWAKTVEFE